MGRLPFYSMNLLFYESRTARRRRPVVDIPVLRKGQSRSTILGDGSGRPKRGSQFNQCDKIWFQAIRTLASPNAGSCEIGRQKNQSPCRTPVPRSSSGRARQTEFMMANDLG